MTDSTITPVETTLIKPTRGWTSLNLGDLWRYRELMFFLTWRDILVRYKQTALGVGWAILTPLVQMVVFTPQGIMAHDPDGDGMVNFELTSAEDIEAHEQLGHIVINDANFYFECPLLPRHGR